MFCIRAATIRIAVLATTVVLPDAVYGKCILKAGRPTALRRLICQTGDRIYSDPVTCCGIGGKNCCGRNCCWEPQQQWVCVAGRGSGYRTRYLAASKWAKEECGELCASKSWCRAFSYKAGDRCIIYNYDAISSDPADGYEYCTPYVSTTSTTSTTTATTSTTASTASTTSSITTSTTSSTNTKTTSTSFLVPASGAASNEDSETIEGRFIALIVVASVCFCGCASIYYMRKAKPVVKPIKLDMTAADSAKQDARIEREGTVSLMDTTLQDSIPLYWTNHDSIENFDHMVHVSAEKHKYFDEILAASYHPKATQDRLCPTGKCAKTPGGCPCVQPGVGLPLGYRVRRVIRVEDSRMWDRYRKQLRAIEEARQGERIHAIDPPALTDVIADSHPEVFEALRQDLNEVYIWHGTNVRAALSIAQNDFCIDLAGSGAGTMYGAGAYCGESSTKADEYAKDEPGGYYQGVYSLLLCRACMGKMYYTTERNEKAGDKVATGAYDSTLGDRTKHTKTFREFVIYNADQLYPEYIVLYSRMGASDDPVEFERAVQANPFHIELPVYWKSVHRNPKTDPFQVHYVVHRTMQAKLDELAKACGGARITVRSATRIESASIWCKYVQFKRKLYAKLSVRHRLSDSEEELVRMLGGSDQAMAPGKQGFLLPRDIDGKPVLTRKVLECASESEPLSTEYLVEGLNEHFLWHGTSKSVAETIVREDFHIPKSDEVSHGSRFGRGAYFAESLEKSLAYAPASDGIQYVLLCRVLAGSMLHTTKHWHEEAAEAAARQGHDSVLADPNGEGPREFIMLTEDQVYPEYVLEIQA